MQIKLWIFFTLVHLTCLAALIPGRGLADTAPSSAGQIAFSKIEIQVGSVNLTVELADTDEKRRLGLMYRQSLPEDQGMLFVFPRSEILNFWMKNTFIPLSIAFIDEDFKIVDIQDMQPVTSILERPRSYQSKTRALMALETNQGWFKKNKIDSGETITVPKDSPSPLLRGHLNRLLRQGSETRPRSGLDRALAK